MIAVLKNFIMTVVAALTLSVILGGEPSQALEDFKVYRGVLILEGEFVPGDYDKLRNFLSDKATFEKITGGVFLASGGGNLVESVKIGRLIRSLRLSTDAPSGPQTGGRKFGESLIAPNDLKNPARDYRCSSACFLVYAAGIYRGLNWAGRLGIHKPFQRDSDAKKVAAADTPERDARVRSIVDAYFREMDVRIKYVDLMFSVPSSEIRWITQDELDADLHGFIPQLKDLVEAKCVSSATGDSSKEKIVPVATGQPGEIAECRTKIQAQIRAEQPLEAWPKVFGAK